MPVSSPAVGPSVFRLAVIAVLTLVLVAAPTIGGIIDLPTGFAVDPEASATGFSCGRYEPVAPAGGVAHKVATQDELVAALAAAKPGDTINLGSGRFTRINYRHDHGHRSGTAKAPIVIQAARGAAPVVDPGDGNVSQRFAVALDRVAHVTVRGLEIRNGFFGALSRGSRSITFEHNNIHRTGQVGVVTDAAEGPSGFEPSSATVIRCNSIHHTGLLEPEYGEGIYVGNGGTGAVDRTSDVLIEGNDIHSIANEAIDVKHFTTNVTIRHNLIHDVRPYYGGAISLGLNKRNWGPANYLVEQNRIWNVSTGRHYAQAIAVAHGPTVIRNNVIWDIDTRVSETWPWTAAVQVHGDDNNAHWAYGFGNRTATAVEITGNTVIGCRQGCIDSHTDTGQIKPSLTVHSNVVDHVSTGDAANGGDTIVAAADLTGPVTGRADSGSGPGSGLRIRAAASPAAASPPTTPTTSNRSSTAAGADEPSTATRSRRASPPPTAVTGSAPDAGPATRSASPTPPSDRSSGTTSGSSAVPADATGPPDRATTQTPGAATSSTRDASTSGASTANTADSSARDRADQTTSARRRGPSDLRLFLDLNIGPMPPTADEPIGTNLGPAPDSPDWLVAMMTPSEQELIETTSSPAIADTPGQPHHDTTTTIDRSGRAQPATAGDDQLPTTTRPASTAGLTTVGDVAGATTMP